jgi:hypothetical protein
MDWGGRTPSWMSPWTRQESWYKDENWVIPIVSLIECR